MALAIPSVMTGGGLLYGGGYLLVTVVYALLFKQATTSSARATVLIAPFNLVVALLLVLAELLSSPWVWISWGLALASVISSGFFRRERGFTLSSPHFVERHGLVISVALGESIVSIGIGVRSLPAGLGLVGLAGLALALAACLWWSYFGGAGLIGEDARAEQALLSASSADRPRMALYGFGGGHLLMIGGIMALAAGIKLAVARPLAGLELSAAWNLAGGLALYLLGDLVFRGVVRIPSISAPPGTAPDGSPISWPGQRGFLTWAAPMRTLGRWPRLAAPGTRSGPYSLRSKNSAPSAESSGKRMIGSGARWRRGLVALLSLPMALLETWLGGGAQLLACVIPLLAMLLAEARWSARTPEVAGRSGG